MGIAGRGGDAMVEGDILGHRELTVGDGRVDRLQRRADGLDVGARRPLGGEPRRLHLDRDPELDQRQHFLDRTEAARLDAERARLRVVGDEGANPLARRHQSLGAQRRDRLAHHRAAHAEGGDHLLLGRQPRAGRERAAGDVGADALHDLMRQAARRANALIGSRRRLRLARA